MNRYMDVMGKSVRAAEKASVHVKVEQRMESAPVYDLMYNERYYVP